MDYSCLVFQGLQPHCSLQGMGEMRLSQHLPARPSHLQTEAPRWRWEGCCGPAHSHPVILSHSSFHYIIFCSEGVGGGGRLRKRRCLQLFFTLSLPSQPHQPCKNTVEGARGWWGCVGRGGTQRESGELMIVHWKNDQKNTHTSA